MFQQKQQVQLELQGDYAARCRNTIHTLGESSADDIRAHSRHLEISKDQLFWTLAGANWIAETNNTTKQMWSKHIGSADALKAPDV